MRSLVGVAVIAAAITSGWDNWRTGSHTSTFYQDTGDWSADGIYKANIHWELTTS